MVEIVYPRCVSCGKAFSPGPRSATCKDCRRPAEKHVKHDMDCECVRAMSAPQEYMES